MENINTDINFEIPEDILDEIQQNIQSIIEGFDIPAENKTDVIRKINLMYSKTKQLSITDALTSLYNRRYFELSLEREFLRAKRYKSDLSLAIIDVDLFKTFNDNYGHTCGDFVLKEISHLMIKNFRQTDLLFRYGGEEFVILMPETDIKNAFIPIERLRKIIEEHKFMYKGKSLNVSVSGGIASNKDLDDMWELFEHADKVLYSSKENGRNRISSFG